MKNLLSPNCRVSSQQKNPRRDEFAVLFDHLVGAREKRGWHFEVERVGGFTIDEKLECCWSLHREFTWFGTLQYLVDINRGAATDRPLINPIRHQRARLESLSRVST